MKNNKITVILSALLLLNIIATCFLGCRLFALSGRTPEAFSPQYVLHVGTTDRDASKQIIPTREAREIIENTCRKYAVGYTVVEAAGGWTDEKMNFRRENSFACYFYDTEASVVYAIADELIKALNQNMIPIVRNAAAVEYYRGK